MPYTPLPANTRLPDIYDEGIHNALSDFNDPHHKLYQIIRTDPDSLRGIPVRTQFGYGVIVSMTKKKNFAEKVAAGKLPPSEIPIASFKIQMLGSTSSDAVWNVPPHSLYLLDPKVTAKDLASRPKGVMPTLNGLQTASILDQLSETISRKPVRKPVATLGGGSGDKPKAPPKPAPTSSEIHARLHAVIYNGFLCLEGQTAGGSKDKSLSKFGFQKFGNYAYLIIKNGLHLDQVIQWLVDYYSIDARTEFLLDDLLNKAFAGTGAAKGVFNVQLAADLDMKNFMRIAHRMVTIGKDPKFPNLRVYPAVVNHQLMLCVDLTTNPHFKKRLNQPLKGVAASNNVWKIADGIDIAMFSNRNELVAKVRELRTSGFIIDNIEELKDEVNALHIMQTKARPTDVDNIENNNQADPANRKPSRR